MDATIRGGDYHVVSNLETSGIVNAFWQAQIQATSNGKVVSGGLKPALYDSFDTNHSGKKQEVSLTWEGDAPPRMYANPGFKANGYEVKPDQQKNTFDPLSARGDDHERRRRRRRQSVRRDRADLRRPPPLQYRAHQGQRHDHQVGQRPLQGQRVPVRDEVHASSRASSRRSSKRARASQRSTPGSRPSRAPSRAAATSCRCASGPTPNTASSPRWRRA